MRHVQREGAVGRVALVALALATLGPMTADGRGDGCRSDLAPLAVVEQRLFRHEGLLVADAIVANLGHVPLQNVHVSVELYDFFGELLRAERTVVTPPVLHPSDRASLRVGTPFTQQARTVAYRFTGLRESGAFQSLAVCDAGFDVR